MNFAAINVLSVNWGKFILRKIRGCDDRQIPRSSLRGICFMPENFEVILPETV